jgi:hypothetical protein
MTRIGGALHSACAAQCGCRRYEPVAGMRSDRRDAPACMRFPTAQNTPGRRVSPCAVAENGLRAPTGALAAKVNATPLRSGLRDTFSPFTDF